MFNGLITALRTLTVLPTPGREAASPASALPWFPLVGALIGGLVAALAWAIGDRWAWSAGAATAGVALSAWLTGGLHLDGVGDAADGYFGGRTPARRLEIMKDVRLGAFGVIALVLLLATKIVALERLTALGQWRWMVVPFVLARTAQVVPAVLLPYARGEGGKAEAFVAQAKARHLVIAVALAAALCYGLAGGRGLIVLGAGLGFTLCLTWRLKQAFGGATGDLLGLTSELVETLALFGLAAFLAHPSAPTTVP